MDASNCQHLQESNSASLKSSVFDQKVELAPTNYDTLGVKLHEYDGVPIVWEDRPTCWMSTAQQTTKLWGQLRIGAITMSGISTYVGRSSFPETPYVSASIICGLSSKSFSVEQTAAMGIGILGEPLLRSWYQDQLTKQAIAKHEPPPVVREVGVAVWKKDPRFRGSMDADVTETLFAEFKIPTKMYRPLIEHIECVRKGYTPQPGEHAHIYNSHYDQMMGNGVIHGKTHVDYVVFSHTEKAAYTERLPVSTHHWDTVLYPQGVNFYEQYVAPLMVKHGINRIDP